MTANTLPESAPLALDGKASAIVTGGSPPYSYEWQDAIGTPIGQATQTATGLAAASYKVKVTDFNGCIFLLDPVVVS